MSTLFVSYTHLDWKDWVKPLVEAIQAQDHVVAVADSAMRIGDPIPDWIRERVLRLQENGKLVLRCEAVRQVAQEALRLRGRWA